MDAYLVLWGEAGSAPVVIDRPWVTVGRAKTNDVALPNDPQVSRVHAVLEQYPSGWSVRDLGSANGTRVNGDHLTSEQVLRPGPFAQPATAAEIATALVVSEAPVKFHLANLYDEFDIGEPSATRRARLAEAALGAAPSSGQSCVPPTAVPEPSATKP